MLFFLEEGDTKFIADVVKRCFLEKSTILLLLLNAIFSCTKDLEEGDTRSIAVVVKRCFLGKSTILLLLLNAVFSCT